MLTFHPLFLSLIISLPLLPILFFPSLSLSLSTTSSHSLTHLLLLMKCCIIRIADCRTVTGPIGPPHMRACITRNTKHTHRHTYSALICPLSSHQSNPKPFSIIYTHTRTCTCIGQHTHTVVEWGWGEVMILPERRESELQF